MQRIIQINIAGRLIPIEEDAYLSLKAYITSLEQQFANEEGKDEIIQDIENRIAELFSLRLQAGAPAIDLADVRKVAETLGPAHDLGDHNNYINPNVPAHYSGTGNKEKTNAHRRLYRDPDNRMLGGVCGGIGRYFGIDPVIIRLIFALFAIFGGAGILVYIVAWAVVPLAKTPQQLEDMRSGNPPSIHDMAQNMGEELHALKKRAEKMSRELKDFFSRKK